MGTHLNTMKKLPGFTQFKANKIPGLFKDFQVFFSTLSHYSEVETASLPKTSSLNNNITSNTPEV